MDFGENSQPRRLVDDENKQVCPYLGMRDDAQLRYSFPETLNCCHRVSRPQRVALDHQREVCLAGTYQTACPVYAAGWKGPLPKELRGVEHQPRSAWGTAGLAMGGLALVIIMAAVFIYFKWSGGPAGLAGNDQATPTSPAGQVYPGELTRSATPDLSFSATPAATSTPALPSPTLSPTPQGSPTASQSATLGTPTPGPQENTPFGPNGRYVVHKVKDGELMETIATLYHTSPAVLKAINGLKTAGFWPGYPAVVAVGEADPNNVFPMQAVLLDQPMRLDVLAAKYATTVDELRSFNGLGPGDTAPGGRWIVARKQ